VADSQKKMKEANLESFRNLEENCIENGIDLAETPLVLQFNKRDLPDLMSMEELNDLLNKYNAPFYESVATTGIGVHETLKGITKLVIHTLQQRHLGDRTADAHSKQAAHKTATVSAPTPVSPPEPPADVVVEPPAALVAEAKNEPETPEAFAVESIPLAPPEEQGPAPELAAVEESVPAEPEDSLDPPAQEECLAEEEPVIEGLLLRAPMSATASEETENFADLTAEFEGQEPFLPTPGTPEKPEAALPEPTVPAAQSSPVDLGEDDPLGLGEGTAPTAAAVLPTSLPLVLQPGQEEVYIPLEVRSGERVERFKLRLHISLGRDD
jgi:hypothetical protein